MAWMELILSRHLPDFQVLDDSRQTPKQPLTEVVAYMQFALNNEKQRRRAIGSLREGCLI
jgi:hypothetical protein